MIEEYISRELEKKPEELVFIFKDEGGYSAYAKIGKKVVWVSLNKERTELLLKEFKRVVEEIKETVEVEER